jgi:phosphatidate cytidylyltransferase
MNNTLTRLAMFCVGIPLLLAIILYLPHYNHALLAIMALVFVSGASLELTAMFERRGFPVTKIFFVANSIIPALSIYVCSIVNPSYVYSIAFIATAIITTIGTIPFAFVSTEKRLADVLPRFATTMAAAAYPGLGASCIMLIITSTREASVAIIFFAMLTLSNDSLAWLFGMAFGKRRGIVYVSPNKSLVGFLAGLSASIIASLLGPFFFPATIAWRPLFLVFLGFAIGIANILGDLFESALKRSTGVKDSGDIMPGRGGFLDSFDNLLFASPFFILIVKLFNLF